MIPALLRPLAIRLTAVVWPSADAAAARLVWGLTIGAVAAAVGFVLRFGSNCPVGDEWYLTRDVLRGGFGWQWVVEHHNEHRYVLAKLVWYGLLAATGFDYRAGMFATVAMLAAAVGLLLAAVRRLRGRLTVADVLPAAVLLHWGHWFAWLMGYQVAFASAALCAAGFAWAAATAEPGQERRAGWRAAAFLLPLALCGGFGVAFAGPLAGWVAWVAVRHRAWPLLLAPAAAAGYVGFAVLTTPPSVAPTARPGPLAFAEAVLQYLGTGFGPWAGGPGWGRTCGGLLAVGWYAVAVGGLLRAVVRDAAERTRAGGLLAVLAGHFAVAAAIGLYRGESQGERFVTPSAAGLAVAWVAVVRYGPHIRPWTVAVAAAVLFAANLPGGYKGGMIQRMILKGFLADVDRGVPAVFLAGKYGGQWLIYDPHATNIASLRDFRVGPFRRTPADPPLRSRPAPLPTPPFVPGCENAAFLPGGPPRPVVRLADAPGPAVGLRLRVEQHRHAAWQELTLRWTADGREHTAAAHPIIFPNQQDLIFMVSGVPTNVRLEPACPLPGLTIHAVDWLEPAP